MAIEKLAISLEVVWHSFELNPTAPHQMAFVPYLCDKFGITEKGAYQMLDHKDSEFAKLGIPSNRRMCKPGTAFNTHRLIHLDQSKGLGTKAENSFFKGYFCDGKAIGEPSVRKELALEIGLGAQDIDDVLSSLKFAKEVNENKAQARNLGIRGVPYFVINEKRSSLVLIA